MYSKFVFLMIVFVFLSSLVLGVAVSSNEAGCDGYPTTDRVVPRLDLIVRKPVQAPSKNESGKAT
jgi:hypothetical protein